jgi:uncharacterized DUF497 family protein
MKINGFDWDSGNWPKCGKHGVSREEIEQLLLSKEVLVTPDIKHSTPVEDRHIAAGRVNDRAMFVVFAFRNNLIRPISARYMHPKEAKHYEIRT